MREDMHTTNPEAAAAWQRHHAPEHLPDRDPDPDDFSMGLPGCDNCRASDCLSCAFNQLQERRWA